MATLRPTKNVPIPKKMRDISVSTAIIFVESFDDAAKKSSSKNSTNNGNKVKIDPYALEFTPRILKIDSDVIFAALSSGRWKDSHRGSPLQFVPRSIRSKIEFDYHVAEFKRAARIPGQIGLISRRHVH